MRYVSFLNGVPALIVEKERLLAIGDLHIGIEDKFSGSGIAFPNAAKRAGEEIARLCAENGAVGIVLLGDVKHGLGNVTRQEMAELREFFHGMRGLRVTIARGNHDAYLGRMLDSIDAGAVVRKEVLLDDVALMHGNSMPSAEAVMKRYIVCGHAHMAAQVNGIDRKAWLVAPAGAGMEDHYERYNKGIRLVVAPAFNRLIVGSRMGPGTEEHIPLLNNGLFDFSGAKAYDLYGNELSGSAPAA